MGNYRKLIVYVEVCLISLFVLSLVATFQLNQVSIARRDMGIITGLTLLFLPVPWVIYSVFSLRIVAWIRKLNILGSLAWIPVGVFYMDSNYLGYEPLLIGSFFAIFGMVIEIILFFRESKNNK